ncbi:uncharacterized protein LAJ45_01333 [Morchella importuna]|uniref:uncharacterized protein n=1 Tax=Morchella importuna TaxID=1174673 RepID=UPI001E8CF3D9|nr:uncharacterized protein LAJ45_01333 [Morchella importuna]KAH8154802.1 hypothetical protein LAJ45_01333 [Morchella importuna]
MSKEPEPTQCKYASFISSETFTLYAGQSQKPYRVHKELLAAMSPELRNHIFNDMKEGHESCMRMEHVTPQTMCQFLEFCYTGKYAEFADDGDKKRRAEVQAEKPTWKQAGILKASALMSHAKLYVLGDIYNVQRLKNEALRNINEIMKDLSAGPQSRMPDVAEECINLMRYACDNLPERSAERGIDPLVKYLAHCAAWGLDFFRNKLPELLSTGGRVDFTETFLALLRFRGVEGPPWEGFKC